MCFQYSTGVTFEVTFEMIKIFYIVHTVLTFSELGL